MISLPFFIIGFITMTLILFIIGLLRNSEPELAIFVMAILFFGEILLWGPFCSSIGWNGSDKMIIEPSYIVRSEEVTYVEYKSNGGRFTLMTDQVSFFNAADENMVVSRSWNINAYRKAIDIVDKIVMREGVEK